jgi:hypothetical protein
LRLLAERMALCLNPDGNYSDGDRARLRGIVIGPQGFDGMSKISGYLTPEARAGLDAVFAKWAAQGMCNPADETPTVKGTPSQQAIDADTRSRAQRAHDGLNAAVRSVLASKELGAHNGLPATIIVTATLQDLEAKTGKALTAGGALLPMSDVVRLARHAYHYLLIYDGITSRPLYLGKTKRIASADQRIVLHALDRGCTFPGCDMPGYLTEVHHVDEWVAHDGPTNIDKLTFACAPHHQLITPGGWATRKGTDGTTEWISPPEQGTGQPRTNDFHHPEKLLKRNE